MLKKHRARYNELLKKFLQNEDFMELLSLVSDYHNTTIIEERKLGIVSATNPYERLIKDLETREDLLK